MSGGEPVALVLTALPVEMAAVLAHLGGDRSSALAGPVLCEAGDFTASGGRTWRVVAAELGPGTVDTAGAVVALAARFRADVVMFAGIAGALKDDVTIGDVVAGTEVAWTERGRWSPGDYQVRVRTVSLSAVLSQLARKIAREGSWTSRLARPRPGAKAVVGQIASGEKVVADEEYRAWLRATFSDAVAIENEGFGLARAAEIHADGLRYVVRGISDNADGSKSDDGHADAAAAAAAFAFALLGAYSTVALSSDEPGIAGRARASGDPTDTAVPPGTRHRGRVLGEPEAQTAEPKDNVMAAARTLPRDTASFTGRKSELALLADEADEVAASTGGLVGICAIEGMAGIGKTALAVRAAHMLASRFPDGQVFLPLHGHTPGVQPSDPSDALASLLQTIGVAARQIPADLDGRARLWRDRLAGKQMLLLLDDAAGHKQVRPLLPGSAGCLVLVTSRLHLTALEDVRLISLDILPPGDAAALLARLADRPGLDPGDPGVERVARLCGYLPLAIGMLGRQLYHHPAWTPGILAETVSAARDRLALMRTENLSVAAAFDLSYQHLDPGQQRLFRRLGLHPGTDFDAYAAAALDGTSYDAARSGLDSLYDHYLLAEPVPGRYRFHDLVAEHARTLAAADPREDIDQAINRLFSYYIHTAGVAGRYQARRTPVGEAGVITDPLPRSPDLNTAALGVAWLDAERVNLHAAVMQAASGHPRCAIAIPAVMHGYLRDHGPWDRALVLHKVAADAARRVGDVHAEANALIDIGDIQHLSGDYPAATASLSAALKLYRALGSQHGQANVLAILGRVQYFTSDNRAAAASLKRAIKTFCALGDELGEAGALAYLSHVQRARGDYVAAKAGMSRALELMARLGNRVREAAMLNFLGGAQQATGDHREAISSQFRALELYREVGDPLGVASTLGSLGAAQLAAGDYPAAAIALGQALEMHHDLGNRRGEAGALRYLGVLRRLTGEYPAAAASLTRALDVYRSIGDRLGEAEVLNAMGELSLVTGAGAKAFDHHQQALSIASAIVSLPETAHALEGIANCQLREGEREQAAAALRQALAIFRQIGSTYVDRIRETLRNNDL